MIQVTMRFAYQYCGSIGIPVAMVFQFSVIRIYWMFIGDKTGDINPADNRVI